MQATYTAIEEAHNELRSLKELSWLTCIASVHARSLCHMHSTAVIHIGRLCDYIQSASQSHACKTV